MPLDTGDRKQVPQNWTKVTNTYLVEAHAHTSAPLLGRVRREMVQGIMSIIPLHRCRSLWHGLATAERQITPITVPAWVEQEVGISAGERKKDIPLRTASLFPFLGRL